VAGSLEGPMGGGGCLVSSGRLTVVATGEPAASVCLPTNASATGFRTLSLRDALPIFSTTPRTLTPAAASRSAKLGSAERNTACQDRKSTRLNSSHVKISYAVFCLKKKKHRALRNNASDLLNWIGHSVGCRPRHGGAGG